jgi:hypothetical protein
MKSTRHFFTLLALLAFSAGAWAQTSGSTGPVPKKKHKPVAAAPAPPAVTAADVQALKDALAAQQQQIQQLSQQLQQSQQNWQAAQAAAADAANRAAAAQTQASQQQQAVGALQGDVADIKTTTNNTAMSLQESLKDVKNVSSEWETPVSIHLKGVTITPGGFAAAEFVRRSRELGADVITPFNSLTMPGASQSRLPEFFGTGRQSRPTIFVGGRLSNVELSSYVSGDFLSSGTTSNNNQTNGYTLRLRQAWGQAKFNNGWKFLGGQAWSLLTEMKAGIAPSDDLGRVNDARPSTIDGQYNVGFTYARQYTLRLTKDFGDKVSVAFAIENAQGTVTTHNNAANFLLGQAGATNEMNAFNGTYTANPAPDLIAKIAFDPGFGHYEVFGLVDRFTDRIFPCVQYPNYAAAACNSGTAASALNAYNTSKEGGGIGANARWTFANKHVVFGLHGFGGSGIGRYGAAGLSDVSIHADGTIHMIKNLQGLSTLEWHGKKLDLYSYVGAEYAGRSYDYDPTFSSATATAPIGYVGYGSPFFRNDGCYTEQPPSANSGFAPGTLSHCTADTRAIIEGTAGFWYSFYNGPKGRFRFGTQYSYVTRQTWSGANSSGPAGISPEGLDGMVFTSFRYYLP